MKVTENKLLMWSIISLPIIDILNGFALKVLRLEGIGICAHIVILFMMLRRIIPGRISKTDIWIFIIATYMILQTVITNLVHNLPCTYAISYIVKYIYFFVTLAALDLLRSEKNIWNLIKKYYTWLYPLGNIIPRILGMNFSSYGSGEGILGFMYSKNSYTFVMIVVLYWSLEALLNKYDIKNLVRLALALISLLLIGSKSGYIFSALIIFYVVVKNMRQSGTNKKFRVLMTTAAVALMLIYISIMYDAELYAIYSRVSHFWKHYGHDSISAVLNFLTSDRWSRISEYAPEYSRNLHTIFWGLGYAFFKYQVTTEMDIFNLLFIFGIAGFVLYIISFIKLSRIFKYKNTHKFLIICLAVYLFFGGHVLADVMANNVLSIAIIMGQDNPKYAL